MLAFGVCTFCQFCREMLSTVVLIFTCLPCIVYGTGPDCLDDPEVDRFLTRPGREFEFECSPGFAIWAVEACYDRFDSLADGMGKRSNGNYDRQWRWECIAISSLRKEECAWSGLIQPQDDIRAPILYQCPKNQYMAGLRTTYDGDESDRFWDVKCCGVEHWCHRDCHLTDFINELKEPFEHISSNEQKKIVFVGFFSEFDYGPDRRWKIEQCRFSLCDLDVIIAKKEDD